MVRIAGWIHPSDVVSSGSHLMPKSLRNLGCRSDPLGLDPTPFKFQKKNRNSCLIVISPRGSNEAKETAGMNVFVSIKAFFSYFFRDKPLIENTAANLMTSDPCQLKLTIEGSERSSRHDLGSIGTDLKPMQKSTPATACQVMTTFAPV